MHARIAIILVVLFTAPLEMPAQKGGHASSARSSSRSTSARSTTAKSSAKKSTSSVPKKSTVAQRASNGKIKRSAAARQEFMKQTGYPKGRKGYVVSRQHFRLL